MSDFREYIKHGWVLTPIKSGTKGAYIPEWSTKKSVNAVAADDAKMLNGAAGLCLAFGKYPILSVDIDDFNFAVDWFKQRDIDIANLLLKGLAIKSPSPNKAKLLYRLAKPFVTRKVMTPEGKVGIEFRCATSTGGTLQDVLPPSPYYDKQGSRIGSYEWSGGLPWHQMPMVPPAILEAAQSLGVSEPRVPEETATLKQGDTPIEKIDWALDRIPPADDYHHWLSIGMAIHSEHPTEEGLATWMEWSSRVPEKYDEGACYKTWGSFRQTSNGVTLGTLFGMVPKTNDPDFQPLTETEEAKLREKDGTLIERIIRSQSAQVAEKVDKYVLLPGHNVSYPLSAESIYRAAKEVGGIYRKGKRVVVIEDGDLIPVNDVRFVSLVDEIAKKSGRDIMYVNRKEDTLSFKEARLNKGNAQILLDAEQRSILDEVRTVSPTPFITEQGEILRQGFHPEHGVYVAGGEVEDVPFDDAREDLLALFDDFDTQDESDLSRMMAAIITPALKPGGMVVHSPLNLYEADKSQAGKGLAAETPALIYGTVAANIKKRLSGGVGSLEESIDSQLAKGRTFINLDNWKGNLNSGWFEGLLTAAPSSHEARIPHVGYVEVNPAAVNWALTSNGMKTTPDLINRINYIKLRKKPSSYEYVYGSKDGYHANITDNQPYYLGCVMAVVKRWIEDEKPLGDSGGHTFIRWAQTLDYIVTKYFGLSPLMQKVEERKGHIGDPSIHWARLVCMAVDEAGKVGHGHSASELVDILMRSSNDADILPNGSRLSELPGGQHTHIGQQMGPLRKKAINNRLDLDHFTLEFGTRPGKDDRLPTKTYTVLRDGKDAFDLADEPPELDETSPDIPF